MVWTGAGAIAVSLLLSGGCFMLPGDDDGGGGDDDVVVVVAHARRGAERRPARRHLKFREQRQGRRSGHGAWLFVRNAVQGGRPTAVRQPRTGLPKGQRSCWQVGLGSLAVGSTDSFRKGASSCTSGRT